MQQSCTENGSRSSQATWAIFLSESNIMWKLAFCVIWHPPQILGTPKKKESPTYVLTTLQGHSYAADTQISLHQTIHPATPTVTRQLPAWHKTLDDIKFTQTKDQ